MLRCPWRSAHKSYHLDILKHAYSKLLGGLESCFTPHIAYPLNINAGNYVLPFNTDDPSSHAGDLKSSPRVGRGSCQCNISFPFLDATEANPWTHFGLAENSCDNERRRLSSTFRRIGTLRRFPVSFHSTGMWVNFSVRKPEAVGYCCRRLVPSKANRYSKH